MQKSDKNERFAARSLFAELEKVVLGLANKPLPEPVEELPEGSPKRSLGPGYYADGAGFRFGSQSSCFWRTEQVDARVRQLKSLTGDQYRDIVITPVESPDRWPAPRVIRQVCEKVFDERKHGALYLARGEMSGPDGPRKVAFMGQNRKVDNGSWGAEHHTIACEWVREMEQLGLPIVTFMDTPGADAGEKANAENQAHSISRLIAEIADLTVPVVGVVLGVGYSGGAIPLASGNVLLSVKDALFNTIQPRGLAAIARKQRLSWFACAQKVGVSAAELCREGVIDSVVDYSPEDGSTCMENLIQAILESIEWSINAAQHTIDKIEKAGFAYLEASLGYCRDTGPTNILYQYSPENYPSVIEYGLKLQRSIVLRGRLRTSTVGQLSTQKVSESPMNQEADKEEEEVINAILAERFALWLEAKERIVYEDTLLKVWKRFQESQEHRGEKRSYVAALFLGDPEDEYEKAYRELCFEVCFYLYNRWQNDAVHHLRSLVDYLEKHEPDCSANQFAEDCLTLLDVIRDELFSGFIITCAQHLIRLDGLYDVILDHMTDIVTELAENQRVSANLIESLLGFADISGDVRQDFLIWLNQVKQTGNLSRYMQFAEQWKRTQHPRMSEVLFVVVSYFFDRLFPDYFTSIQENKNFGGQFTPVSIGRRKDFWNRLVEAEKDLRIQAVLNDVKPTGSLKPLDLIGRFFQDFIEFDAELTTSNPCSFPGFDLAIAKQAKKGRPASGIITGVARYFPGKALAAGAKAADDSPEKAAHSSFQEVGVVVSNHAFQAGAFDMSSAERFCRLLTHCAKHHLPVVGFLCSAGMQTKEGAASLFSMAVVNEQINRFVAEVGQSVLFFGYGDCTGGAQASLVTHPLVQTWYFSGTNMPFAGRIVVPDFLPVTSTLSNYLVKREGSMQGLVRHPFIPDLDSKLAAVDSDIILAARGVNEVIDHWLIGTHPLESHPDEQPVDEVDQIFEPFDKVLVHARGCTAVKLIDQVQKAGLKVVLVQSDPDMDSVAADRLGEADELICLGGYTSDESYLNGDSVLRIANLQNVRALHPGIGFLSENPSFARQCLLQGVNFIGPSPQSMEMMGDKSQAIKTAMSMGVPVVPGSHGVLVDEHHALQAARETGFPVILKAAHGGGGKGIVVVEDESSLVAKFLTIKAEARSSFGRDDIYLERFVTRFRHIEVQLLRDRFGHCFALGIRDCSIQRNKQKIIEESGSTLLPPEKEIQAKECAINMANACHYVGAGTVEFIFDLDRNDLYFMEMNTRLQVEHPVTELVSGVNIVAQQLKIAAGESIENLAIEEKGYALEVRINAERVTVHKAEVNVEPTPGQVEVCEFPDREGISGIISIGSDKPVPPYYDNLVAQIIAHGENRQDAIDKMSDYLASVKVTGISTNIALVSYILKDSVFVSGDYDTAYLPELAIRSEAQLSNHLGASAVPARKVDWESEIRVEGSDELKVFAPSNCIMYRCPSPGKPEFVEKGDIITTDHTLCLLEVMKMFQPLTLASFNQAGSDLYCPESKYRITHVKGVDGQQVNKGDLLFVVKPVVD
ncbi:MAG: carbamoyl-phosphate synthase large subunit [Gammaproteobacteria bacterium]|nr:MAG: carbamoyl-phosphate synthase large subunit [Pseudomonadota bacterium]PIE38985.1 MAG: carbamoyl-phosphate synthase large subunit [Gammaproteobacteria bacterium]